MRSSVLLGSMQQLLFVIMAMMIALPCFPHHHFGVVVVGLDNGLGLTPPLAWSSWNYFNGNVNSTLVREIADALVSTGLADLGFRQVNIDSGYLERQRDAHNQMVVKRDAFPEGMRALSDYLALRGLGLGLYTDITNHVSFFFFFFLFPFFSFFSFCFWV